MIISINGVKTTLSFNLAFKCTNNQVEYKSLAIGLEILLKVGAKDIRIIRDSQLILRQFTIVIQLLDSFDNVEFEHVLGESN